MRSCGEMAKEPYSGGEPRFDLVEDHQPRSLSSYVCNCNASGALLINILNIFWFPNKYRVGHVIGFTSKNQIPIVAPRKLAPSFRVLEVKILNAENQF